MTWRPSPATAIQTHGKNVSDSEIKAYDSEPQNHAAPNAVGAPG